MCSTKPLAPARRCSCLRCNTCGAWRGGACSGINSVDSSMLATEIGLKALLPIYCRNRAYAAHISETLAMRHPTGGSGNHVLEAAKQQLLLRIQGLQRGSAAGSWSRALVEEAQVSRCDDSCMFLMHISVMCARTPPYASNLMQVELEAFGGDIDFKKLAGLWRLVYTTADDVVGTDPPRNC